MRRGNFAIMTACMYMLSPLFYGLNMAIYMDINHRLDKMIQTVPPDVLKFISNSICLSQSGHPSKAEGCDFILECVNKKIKAWVPPGVPTQERWTRICRNLPSMEEMKKGVENKVTAERNDEPSFYFR